MSYARWTPAAAQTNTCPPHTWIRSWDRDVEALQASVLAAGWQWHLALTPHPSPTAGLKKMGG